MEVSVEEVLLCLPVYENGLTVLEEKYKLANCQLSELFYLNRREMVLERGLYFVMSES